MPIKNRFSELHPEITSWRRDIHANPELMFDLPRTANKVAELLREFGCDEVVEGMAKTGVVGVIKGRGQGSGRTVGLRADMDALPITEETALEYASQNEGVMHACGHDGHTSMLLGAAKYLAETRNFDGTAVVIFQPAEEGGGGGRVMVEEGLMERFSIDEVYGMHNWPGVEAGSFSIRAGSFFAATDEFHITVKGKGGHAAKPQEAVDSIVTASQIVTALQTIASRNVDPVKQVVVSVCAIESSSKAYNVLPPETTLRGTVRDLAEQRLREIAEHTAQAAGAEVEINYRRGYPVMSNADENTEFAREAARKVSGACGDAPLIMGGEDFAYMAIARPAAYILIGNGESAPVHHPAYNFNDEIIPMGCSWFTEMVESRLPID